MYWEAKLVSFPTTVREAERGEHNAEMTSEGMAKLQARHGGEDVELEPGLKDHKKMEEFLETARGLP